MRLPIDSWPRAGNAGVERGNITCLSGRYCIKQLFNIITFLFTQNVRYLNGIVLYEYRNTVHPLVDGTKVPCRCTVIIPPRHYVAR